MKNVSKNELTTLLALLEWAGGQKDILKKLEKTAVYRAAVTPPKPPAGKAVKKPKPVKNPLTATTFSKKVRNSLIQGHSLAKQDERIGDGMVIKEWLRTGEIEDEPANTKVLLQDLAAMLDSNNVSDIVGTNLFRGSDDRYYTVVVEASIEEADDEFVDDILQDIQAEEDGDDEEADPEEVDTVPEDQPGKPLVEVLDTSDAATPVFAVVPEGTSALLDKIEKEIVLGADALTRESAQKIRDTAAGALGLSVIPDSRIEGAWRDYLDTPLPELKADLDKEVRAFTEAGGRGVELAEQIDRMRVVVALREAGVDDVEDLALARELDDPVGAVDEFAAKAVSEQAATAAGVALGRPVGPVELKEAWGEYGSWDEATLADQEKKLSTKLGHSMGMGEDTRDELAKVSIALAVKKWIKTLEAKNVADEPGVGAAPTGS